MDHIIASAQLVFAGSADTQVFLISEKHQSQKFLISFSGFLNSTSDSLDNFRCNEIDIYTGANVQNIIETTMKRSEKDVVSEHHSFRRFDLTPVLAQKIVEWMFSSDVLQSLD